MKNVILKHNQTFYDNIPTWCIATLFDTGGENTVQNLFKLLGDSEDGEIYWNKSNEIIVIHKKDLWKDEIPTEYTEAEVLVFSYNSKQAQDCVNFELHFLQNLRGEISNAKIDVFKDEYPDIYKKFLTLHKYEIK